MTAIKDRRIFIGLPAFNEEIAIQEVLKKIESLTKFTPDRFGVIVYNDGSTDSTVEIAKLFAHRIPLTVIGTTENCGLGAALRGLVNYVVAIGSKEDILVIMDCDDTHNPEQIMTMIKAIDDGHDIVIASRFKSKALTFGVPLRRRLTALGAMLLFKTLRPILGVLDYTCGYRAYRVSLLSAAHARFGNELITETGFACMVEFLLKLSALRPKVFEIPLILRYDLKPTASKMDVGSNIVQLLRLVVRGS